MGMWDLSDLRRLINTHQVQSLRPPAIRAVNRTSPKQPFDDVCCSRRTVNSYVLHLQAFFPILLLLLHVISSNFTEYPNPDPIFGRNMLPNKRLSPNIVGL